MGRTCCLFVIGITATSWMPGEWLHAQNSPQPHCTTVHGRYAIYANGDRLWISGSKHFLSVGNDKLDQELEERGWENTAAYGNFTICSLSQSDPKHLTIRDNVSLRGYSHLRFQHR